jgi:hypothetical protein
MESPFRYIRKLFSRFDVSPIESGGITKTVVFVIWGINALFFLGKDLIIEHNSSSIYSDCCSVCTVTKKISTADLYVESISFINTTYFIVISSFDYELPSYDVITVIRDRSPPQGVLLFV